MTTTIPVRPHFFTGAALLALGAILGVATALRPELLAPDLHVIAYLGGLTLVAQGITFWYLPSFAKRSVVLDGMASYAGPILFPLATLGTALGQSGMRAAGLVLGLVVFAVVVLASAIAGPRWRSGIPFWRVPGEHQRGDIIAAIILASALLWFAGAGLAALLAPPMIVVAWPVAVGLLALGGLAHLVPRSRSRPLNAPLLLAAVALGEAGALGATLAREGIAIEWARAARALLAAFALAALAIAPPGRRKSAGARARDASPFLWAALGALLLAAAAASARRELTLAHAITAYYALLAAVGLATAALALVTTPVLFNQKPMSRLILPASLVFLGAATLLAASLLTPLPRWPAAALLAATLLLWLVAMSPLREPRRQC